MEQKPLAEILRPSTLSDFVGQEHLVGPEGIVSKLLKEGVKTKYFPSLILWGPPGCGKTTLARIIATELKKPFFDFSAVNTSIKDIEKEIAAFSQKERSPLFGETKSKNTFGAPIIFIDEIHRFNKAQQDALLPHVEQGRFILIGATTENPSFEVIGPLLSRTRVIILKQLSNENLGQIIKRALKQIKLEISTEAEDFLKESSNGDARVAINVLEIASHLSASKKIDVKTIQQALQKSQLAFDLRGEEYYNTISALHKSIRGSDPDAALYYLARMLEAGQDPIYIARRLIRCASEDIGLTDPQALNLAVSTFLACERIGMPECNLALAEAVVYLAKSPKSNKLYMAYGRAAEDVYKHGNLPVPLHIRNAPTKLMEEIGYGKDYDYFHSPEGKKKPDIEYFPDKLKGRKYL
jgi:putative ATPase